MLSLGFRWWLSLGRVEEVKRERRKRERQREKERAKDGWRGKEKQKINRK